MSRHHSRLLIVVAVTVAFALVAELGVRLLATHLPTPLKWSSDEAQVKSEDLRSRFADREAGVVFVGSSMMDAAVDPGAVSARLPGAPPAYNAALLGSPMEMIELWTTEEVVPVARPSLVVVGVSCREVNGAESEQAGITDEFKAAPAMRIRLGSETALDRATRSASRLSYLVRYRSVLRQPRNLFGRDRRTGHLLDMSDSGMNTAFQDARYPPADLLTEVLFPGSITRFRVSGEALDSLGRLAGALRSQDIGVLVVSMPVTEDFVSWMPRGQESHAECVEAIRDASEGAGADYLDAGIWERHLFADPIHLNGSGSHRMSALTADAARGLLEGSARR